MRLEQRHLFVLAGLTGGTSLMAQTLILRAFLVIAHGPEIVLGVGLAAWLFWSALGSAAAGRWAEVGSGGFDAVQRLAKLQRLLALSLPLTLAYFSAARPLWSLASGELLSLGQALAVVFPGVAPLGLVNGALYTALCALAPKGISPGQTVPQVYTGEAVGSGLGGLLFTLAAYRIHPQGLAVGLALAQLACAHVLTSKTSSAPGKRITTPLIVLGVVALAWGGTVLSSHTLTGRGATLRLSRSTPYQEVAALELDGQLTFYQNGLPALTRPDTLADETTAHLPLLIHPAPRSALFIGGTAGGTLREALKHPDIAQVTYVEGDPVYLRLVRSLSPDSALGSAQTDRVRFVSKDARRYLQGESRRFDVIAMTLPPPLTARLNRFYTVEWFRRVQHHLNPGGILTLALPASENALNPEMRAFLRFMAATLGTVFGHVQALPGESVLLIAGDTPRPAVTARQLSERLRQRGVQTRYVRDYYLDYQLDPLRQSQLDTLLKNADQENPNRDFNVRGLTLGTALWQSRFVSQRTGPIPLWVWIAAAGALIWIVASRQRRRNLIEIPGRTRLGLAVVVLGFTEMALQMLLIYAYQVLAGAAYAHMALIMAGYMAGLALGSAGSRRMQSSPSRLWARLAAIQGLMALWPGVLLILLHAPHLTGTLPAPLLTALFALLAATAGALGGHQFPLANRLAIPAPKGALQRVGFLYALDLAGATAGALCGTGLLLPRLGFGGATAVLCGANALVAVALITAAYTKARS